MQWNVLSVDSLMLVKLYDNEPAGEQTRYSPANCGGTRAQKIMGNPHSDHIYTSHVERMRNTCINNVLTYRVADYIGN